MFNYQLVKINCILTCLILFSCNNTSAKVGEFYSKYLTHFNTEYNENSIVLSWGVKKNNQVQSLKVEGSKDLKNWRVKSNFLIRDHQDEFESSFTDHFPSNYYRISILDINGTILERKCVIISAIVPNFELKVYSDAETRVKPTILLLDEIDPAQKITMTIYNEGGSIVYNTIISVVCKDKIIKNLYLPKTLGSGLYMIELHHMSHTVKDSFVIN